MSEHLRIGKVLESAAKRGLRGPSSRGEWRICCPFCAKIDGKADAKFKLHMNPGLGVFNCFKCGSGGKADLAWLGKPVEIEVPRSTSLGPPDGFETLSASSLAHRPYVKYLEERGVADKAFLLGFGACRTGRFAGRVIVPHMNWLPSVQGHAWIGFAARAIYPEVEPKYLYPAGMNRAGTLWGMHLPWSPETWLVEGVFDALALYPAAVAAFGKNVTDDQIDLLLGNDTQLYSAKSTFHGVPLFVCLDGDAWEEAKILQMRLKLRGAAHVEWCRLPPGTDPGSLGWKVRNYLQLPNGEGEETA